MKDVWSESSTQAFDMLQEFTKPSSANLDSGTSGTFEGLKRITINVIGSVCFGTEKSWAETTTVGAPPGFKTTFIESIITIVNNLFPTVFIPAKYLSHSIAPKSMQTVGVAKTEFPLHLRKSIEQERRNPSSKSTLLTSLVKLADQDKKSTTTGGSKTSTYLSEEEIAGNLFTFTIAGFDTTANTLAYAVAMLAMDPQLQDWIIEQIDEISQKNPENDYATTFPLLTRCLALMVNLF